MIEGPAAVKRCGMVAAHAEVFERVANRTRTVIASRELNPLSEGLLVEGYASKGFYIKAKSCDWGPMAGFVCVDPRFTKSREIEKQVKYIQDALRHGAGQRQIVISSLRLVELDRLGIIEQKKNGSQATRILIQADSPDGLMYFVAERTVGAEPIWKISLLPPDPNRSLEMNPDELEPSQFIPVMGLTNKPVASAGVQPTGPKAAVAGDYDLFAVWPHHPAAHRRPIGPAPRQVLGDPKQFQAVNAYINNVRTAAGGGGMNIPTFTITTNRGIRSRPAKISPSSFLYQPNTRAPSSTEANSNRLISNANARGTESNEITVSIPYGTSEPPPKPHFSGCSGN